jgi:hypothetical protein
MNLRKYQITKALVLPREVRINANRVERTTGPIYEY